MAEEIKKVVSVDVSKAVEDIKSLSDELEGMDGDILDSIKSFKDYKTVIEKLSVSLAKMDEDTDEYEKTLSDLNKVQNSYNEAISNSKTKTEAAAGSYNALAKEMSELKKQWKETNDEAERKALGKRIVEINDNLKGLDNSIGNYQRNVGNYTSAFTEGLENIGAKFEALNSPMALAKKGVGALNTAFKALKANPIGAVIAGIVVAVKALVSAFKNNEEASNKLKKAFSAFEPIINLVKTAMGKVVNIIGDALIAVSKLAEGVQKAGIKIVEWLNKIGVVSDKKLKSIKDTIKEQQEVLSESRTLAEEEIALEERKRKEQVETAKKEAEISELKAKVVETDKYTAKERQEMLQKAIKLEKEINDERLAIAEKEFEIAKKRAAQAPNSKEDNDKLAESEANYYRVKKEYTERAKELNSQLVSSSKELSNQITEETDKLKDAQKVIEDSLNEMDKYLDKETDKSYDQSVSDIDDTDKLRQRVIERDTDPEELELQKREEKYKLEYEQLEGFEYERTLLTEQYEADRAAIIKKYADKRDADRAEEKAKEDAEWYERRDKMTAYMNDAGTILGSVGDAWQTLLDRQVKTGKLSEKEYKRRQKALQAFQIASVVAQTAASLFDLWSGWAKETGIINTQGAQPAGFAAPAVKAALDAKSLISTIAKTTTIAATAATQIAAIKSSSSSSSVSSASSGVSSSSASVSSSASSYTPNYSQTVMGKTDIESLQSAVSEGTSTGQLNTKVYVLESDITDAQNNAKVRVEESEF